MLSLKNFPLHWNKFFFAETSMMPVSAFRIGLGLLSFIDGLMWLNYGLTWFGESGVLPYATARQYTSGWRLDLFQYWPHGDTAVTLFLLLHLLAALTLMLGLFSRASAITLFLTFVTMHHRDVLPLNSGDTELRIFAFFIMFAPSGAYWSLDRFIALRREKPPPPQNYEAWPLRMMQIQYSLIYISSVLWKLEGTNWLDGTALYYATRIVDFHRFPIPFFLNQMWFIKIGTYSSLIIEGGLGAGVWLKEIRPWALIAGLGLHLFIDYTMNIPLFEWVSIALLLLWVLPEEYTRAFSFLRTRFPKAAGWLPAA